MGSEGDVEFFGAHIQVKSAKLAALLNSVVTDDVVVVGKRALDLVSPEQRDEEMNYALGGVEAQPDRRFVADDSDISLDRVFARQWPPSVQH
jgi:hypothetical protein